MSIFGKIKDAIFGHKAQAAPVAPAAPASPQPTTTAAPAPVAPEPVDVEAVLSEMAARFGRPNNWRESIVDLMTLLGLDSSRANRTELAKELGFTGDTNDSATMNIWLHKQVMARLAENGGRVPVELM